MTAEEQEQIEGDLGCMAQDLVEMGNRYAALAGKASATPTGWSGSALDAGEFMQVARKCWDAAAVLRTPIEKIEPSPAPKVPVYDEEDE